MALKTRALTLNDIDSLREIHRKYYHQFEFPFNNLSALINAFIIEDESDEIIMAGAVERVAEIMLVTNKEKNRIKIGKALVEAQLCSSFTCERFDIRDMYAFVDNDEYSKHLIQHGFVECDKALKFRIS